MATSPPPRQVVIPLTVWLDALHAALYIEAGVDQRLADHMARRVLRDVLDRAGQTQALSDEQRAAIAEPTSP